MNYVHVLIMSLAWKFNKWWYVDTDLKVCIESMIMMLDAWYKNDYIVVSINEICINVYDCMILHDVLLWD